MRALAKQILCNLARTSRPGVSQNVQKFGASRFASTYKAAVVNQFNEPLVLKDMKQRTLKANEVRIGVYCCGINSLDIDMWKGEVEPKPALPFVPGFEVCGEVLEVPVSKKDEKPKFRVGDRVIGLELTHHTGGYAEEMIISTSDVFNVGNAVSFADGASLINSYATALIALTRRAEVRDGDFVLVTGAGDRLGIAAVDLAANVYRCKVIAVTTTEERAEALRDRGAYATVILGKEDILKRVTKLTEGEGVPVIIDTVGGNVFKQVIKSVSDEGKVIVAGYATKNIPQISAQELTESQYSVSAVSLERYRQKNFEIYRDAVSEVIDLCKEKLVRPFSAFHFPLIEVNEALKVNIEKKSVGKVVLDIR